MYFAAFRANSFFLFFDRFIPCKAINFVGTSACCVRRVFLELCHKQISRISRNKRSICGIGEICVREKSSDAARNVPTLSLLIAHCSPLKIFLLSKPRWKRKTFLVFTDNNHKRSKTNKNASKRASESAQLEKNNFSTEKKYFSNREIKFSQLAVSGFPAGFMSNCFFVKFFCVFVRIQHFL